MTARQSASARDLMQWQMSQDWPLWQKAFRSSGSRACHSLFSLSLSDANRLTKIQLVKTYLKILAALVSIAILWLGSSYVRYVRDEAVRCDTLTLTGLINSYTFVESR